MLSEVHLETIRVSNIEPIETVLTCHLLVTIQCPTPTGRNKSLSTLSRTTSLSPCATGKRGAFAFVKVLFSYAKWIYIMLKAAKKVRVSWERKTKKALKLQEFRDF